MELVLTEDLFVSNEYEIAYGNRTATFTIIDEEFSGLEHTIRVNRINVVVREYNEDGTVSEAAYQPSVIGMGNGITGVKSDTPALRGKPLSRDNMADCTVILYE